MSGEVVAYSKVRSTGQKGHERRQSPTNGPKISSENSRATQQCVVLVALRSFAAQVSHMDRSSSTGIWLRDWDLACWRSLSCLCASNARACVRGRIFKPAAKKERFKISFLVYNLYQSAEGLLRLMQSDPTAHQK